MLEINEEEHFDNLDKQQLEKAQDDKEDDKSKKMFNFEYSNRTNKKLIDETMDLFKEIKHDDIIENCLGDTTIDASTIQMKKSTEKEDKESKKKIKKGKKGKTKKQKNVPIKKSIENVDKNTKSINECEKTTKVRKKIKNKTKKVKSPTK